MPDIPYQFKQGLYTVDERDALFNRISQYPAPTVEDTGKVPTVQNDGTIVMAQNSVPVYGMGKNLLDNWDFSNPDTIVDQRGGYILVPVSSGTNYYYTDSELTQGAVAITNYTTVYGVSTASTYRSFKLAADDTTTYYAALDVCIRGYNASTNIYTIDRWKCRSGSTLSIQSDCVRLAKKAATTYSGLNQSFYISDFVGKTVTFSVLIKGCTTNSDEYPMIGIAYGNSAHVHSEHKETVSIPDGGSGLYTVTYTVEASSQYTYMNCTAGFFGWADTVGTIDIIAAKLEEGIQQTLCHNEGTEENPVWVLNEHQNFGEELAKCQRYQVNINNPKANIPILGNCNVQDGGGSYLGYIQVPVPTTMRTIPTIVGAPIAATLQANIASYSVSITGVPRASAGMVYLLCTSSATIPEHTSGVVYVNNGGQPVILDANL